MITTKQQIIERIQSGSLGFKPVLDSFQLHEHSIDLRLGFTFLIPKLWHLTKEGREALNMDHMSKEKPEYFEVIELEQGQYFEILPNEYVLVSTLETVSIPNDLMAVLYPRSSTNRRGLSVDLTGIVDAGYEGTLAIPVRNNTSSQIIRLYPGERFCQLVFEELSNTVTPRESKYHRKDVIEGFVQETNNRETELVAAGDIKGLKNEFPINDQS